VQLRKQHVDRWYKKRRYHTVLDFPEVIGLADTALQARINRLIRSAYPPPKGVDAWLRGYESFNAWEPGEHQELSGEYEVTLNRNHLLSIRFSGSDDGIKNGLITGAHPNGLSAGVTLDTRTGRAFKLSDLFAGSRWRERLEEQIARVVTVEPGKPDPDDAKNIQLLREDLKSHQYWYYLQPHSISFYDLYLTHAGGGIEAEISLEQLRPLMNPKGPLPSLLADATPKAAPPR
jgi:hypothetical protein